MQCDWHCCSQFQPLNTATHAFKTSVLKTCELPEAVGADEADEGDELAVLASATELETPAKDYHGWRCSYRRDEPERPKEDVVLRRLEFKHKHFDNLTFEESTRNAPMTEQSAEMRALRKARQANVVAADKLAQSQS
mgnify:CR=1 FL=1